MITAWSERGEIKASYRKDGRLGIRTLGPAEYTAFIKAGARFDDLSVIDRQPDAFPGWERLTFCDYDSRKAALELNPNVLFEADVSPVRRFITDHNCKIERPRRAYIDIETDSRVPFSEAIYGKTTLLSWALVDEEGGKWTGVLEDLRDQAEAELWATLWARMGDYDQICAWNGERFDFSVMKLRCEAFAKRFAKIMDPYWEHRRRLLFVDHMLAFKRHHMAAESGDEKTSMRLGDVCQALIGEGKNEFDSGKTWDAWLAGGAARQELVDYNLQDTALLPKLEAATGYLELQQAIAEITLCPVTTHTLKPMPFIDAYLLKMAHKRKTHLPSKNPGGGLVEEIQGAIVMAPTKLGIHENVHVCDFKSLYPTIIRTFNLGSETKVPVEETPPATACRAATGVYFRTDAQSMLSAFCADMMNYRDHYKKEMKKYPPGTPEWKNAERLSKGAKIANNSGFGVTGNPYFRLYDPDVTSAIIQGARLMLMTARDAAGEREMGAIYGDSITGDRTVVVRDPEDRVQILPIEELYQLGLPVSPLDEKQYVAVPGWTSLTEKGWRPIKSVMRHRTNKAVYRITTKHGQTRVTEDHGIMCDGRPTRPEDFTQFTVVPAPKEAPLQHLDLFEYVRHFSSTRTYKGRPLVRTFVADDEYIYLAGWGDWTQIKIRRHYNVGSPELESLVRLLTCYVADGSASIVGETTTSRFMLSFCKSDREWMERIRADLTSIFEGGAVTGPMWTDTVWVVRSGTAAMACLFAALCGTESHNKRLPSFMYRLDDRLFNVFFDTLSRTDGYIDGNGMKYTSNSQRLTAGIAYVLSQHDVEYAVGYRDDKQAWTLRTRPTGTERNRCKIKREVSETFDGFVYDLTVDDAHTFVDGLGRVLLHNTDSLFVVGGSKEEFEAFVKRCNTVAFPKVLDEHNCRKDFRCVELAYEKQFARLIFPAGQDGQPSAKRYAGSYSHYGGTAADATSKPEIRGLEFMRTDSVRIARHLQREAIEMLLRTNVTADDMHAWIKRQRELFIEGDVPLEDIVLSKSISRPLDEYKTEGPHVRIAKALAEAGEDVGEGTRISYVVIDGKTSPAQVIPASEYNGTFDRRTLWNKAVYPPTMRVLTGAFPTAGWGRWILNPRVPLRQTSFSFA